MPLRGQACLHRPLSADRQRECLCSELVLGLGPYIAHLDLRLPRRGRPADSTARRKSCCVDEFPVVPTNANSADPSRSGGGGGDAQGASARGAESRQEAQNDEHQEGDSASHARHAAGHCIRIHRGRRVQLLDARGWRLVCNLEHTAREERMYLFGPDMVSIPRTLATLAFLVMCSTASAETGAGVVRGEVVDDSGGVMPGVTVVATAAMDGSLRRTHGTIFADTAGTISINETGGFAQIQKGFFNNMLQLSAAGRYDKSTNFTGRFTPRFTAVFQVAKDNFIRASYQTAYRFPSNQNQYIDLQTASAHLIGGLPQFIQFYNLDSNTYDTATFLHSPKPTQYQYKEFKPETVASWEIGYKGVIGSRLFIDVYGFYAQYTNFIGITVLLRDPVKNGINPQNTFGIYTNSSNKVNTVGAGIGLQYTLPKGFFVGGNLAYNDLSNADATVLTQFNTPKIKYNISVGNYNIKKVFGFNVVYRWQDSYLYQSTFISGTTASFGVLDAQISMKLPKLNNSMIKIGATNVLNKYYTDAIGNSQVGGLYYVSLGYNVF